MRTIVQAIIITIIGCSGIWAGISGAGLAAAMDSIESLQLDTAWTGDAGGVSIAQKDFSIRMDSGRVAFFQAIQIDSVRHVCAVYLLGGGALHFAPTPAVEKGQLSRFFKSDSLNRTFSEAVILLDDSLAADLKKSAKPASAAFGKDGNKRAVKFREKITDLSDRPYVFGLLRSLLSPARPAYFAMYAKLASGPEVCYRYDPFEREEVQFSKLFDKFGFSNYLEDVCDYAQDAVGIESSFNGTCKDLIQTGALDIHAGINDKGRFDGSEQVKAVVLRPTRVIDFALHPYLSVDSVTDGNGTGVTFKRYKHEGKSWYSGLYILTDQLRQPGDTLVLNVFSHGDIAERNVGVYYVTAMSSWYPRYGFVQRATFDMHFKTPKACAFTATGTKVSSEVRGDTLVSEWKVDNPTAHVSFSIGYMKEFNFSDTLAGNVDVYYSEDLHREIAQYLSWQGELTGRHMEKQVGDDIVNALRLFDHNFGPIATNRFSVSEVMLPLGIAYPGFVQLGFSTWLHTDAWGYQRLFRAHEVAHQWWGVGVSWETYHDQWLSEGFAEYSAYMYLQAVAGNDQFLDRLKETRKAVVAVREKPSDSSSETGPVILGYRTSSSRSEGDASLVIYEKGALILHMIRNMLVDWRTMKEDKFFALLREFYDTYKGKSANTGDFQHLVEKYMGEDMTWFFDEWVYGTEIPTYKFSYTVEPGANNTFTAKGHVITEGTSPDFRMYVPLEVQIDDKRKAYVRVNIEGPDATFNLPGLPSKPKGLKLNPFESVLAEVKQ